MTYLFYLLGFLPSFVWLLFFLREDAHPESNWEIIKVFLYGMLVAVIAIFLEWGAQKIILPLKTLPFGIANIIQIFIGGALIEEYLKYLVVKLEVLKNAELDEPVDVMLYMIIAGLGFAASENIILVASYYPIISAMQITEVLALRFLTATFLHALCAGIFGYFLAISFLEQKKRKRIFLFGLTIAVTLHGLYNLSIMNMPWARKMVLPVTILVLLTIFVILAFAKLKKMKGLCNV